MDSNSILENAMAFYSAFIQEVEITYDTQERSGNNKRSLKIIRNLERSDSLENFSIIGLSDSVEIKSN